jgi:GT2 family glycosyltransferase
MDVSVLIVHYGDAKPTLKCLKSVKKAKTEGVDFEIILIDNNKNSVQKRLLKKKVPGLRYFKSKKNNYCHALNLGINKSRGEFVLILNPDTKVDKNWMKEILKPFKNKNVGAVSSKILFSKSKKINSLGIEEIDDYYYRDIGMNDDDDDNLRLKTIKYASGCSVAYRKEALKSTGLFDEDFIMYVEDVDMGIRLRKNGWKLKMNPKSAVYHDFHGTTGEVDLASYFCNRNRFLIIAKHHPEDFSKNIKTSHSYINKRWDELYDGIKSGVIKLLKTQNKSVIKKELPKILKVMADIYPLDKVRNCINEAELYLNLRKPSVCIYDHALHFIGGGQKYGCTIAEALQNDFSVTLVSNKKINIKTLEKWYNLKLNKCDLKVIELPINKKDKLINPSLAEHSQKNPFAKVEDEVLNHDLLINVNMVPHVNPISLKSIFLCHFPDGNKGNFFYTNKYDKLITNSKYTTRWLNNKWNLKADKIIYPPADMKYEKRINKENIILSVSRFERTGSKKQYEIAKIFTKLYRKNPKLMKGWKLILAGGSIENNSYLKKVKQYVDMHNAPIKIITNLSNNELKKLYAKSQIFWHACGLNQNSKKSPNLIEHFGMTTVEAMQNSCAPIVINGGGQKEIIEHKLNGFRFQNEKELKKYTLKLIKKPALLKQIQKEAAKCSKKYNKNSFNKNFATITKEIKKDLFDEKRYIPEIHDVYFLLR